MGCSLVGDIVPKEDLALNGLKLQQLHGSWTSFIGQADDDNDALDDDDHTPERAKFARE